MNRVGLYVLVPVALVTAVLVPRIGGPVRAQGNPKVEFIHTGDWQSGDEVSFTVRGVVEDDQQKAGEKQTESEPSAAARGVVEVKDENGNITRMPWTPVLHYTVPAATSFVTATKIAPGGAYIATTRIPVAKAGTPISLQTTEPPTASVVAPPIAQVGKPYRIYSPAGKLTGRGEATLIARGSAGTAPVECKSLAESPHSAVFEPKGLKSGPASFTLREDHVFEATFPVSVIGVNLDTSRVYKVGQPGTLVLEVTGFPQSRTELRKLMASKPVVSLVNETSAILAFTRDPERITWPIQESEVQEGTWRRDIPVIARHAGKFEITATASAPGLINPSGVTAYYKGPSPPAGPNGEKNPDDSKKPPLTPPGPASNPCDFLVQVIRIVSKTPGFWQVEVRHPDGSTEIMYFRFKDTETPKLQKDDWIRVTRCDTNGSVIFVDASEAAAPPPAPAKPPSTEVKVPPEVVKPPEVAKQPASCECQQRKEKWPHHLDKFYFIGDDFKLYPPELHTNTDAALAGALGLADLFDKVNAVKDFYDKLKDRLGKLGVELPDVPPEGEGAGAATVDALLKYLEFGKDILVAGAPWVAKRGMSEIILEVKIDLNVEYVQWWEVEVCYDPDTWKPERRCIPPTRPFHKTTVTLRKTLKQDNIDWGQVVDSHEQKVNSDQLQKWAGKAVRELIQKARDGFKEGSTEFTTETLKDYCQKCPK